MNKKAGSSNPSAVSSSTFLWIAGISTLAAIGVHTYLLNEHYALRFGTATGSSLCNINATWSCAAVSASRFSELLGFPVALLGASANAVLLLFLAWFGLAEVEQKPSARASVLTLSGFIAATSVVMGVISSVILKKGCPFCVVAYVLSFITFAAAWMGLRFVPSRPLGSFKTPIIIVAVAAFATMIARDNIGKSYQSDDLQRYAQEKVREWKNAPAVSIQTSDPLVEGASKETAKMTIVEFADFRCSHCKTAAPVLHAFVSAHPDVRLEFQTWPLDGECNTAISRTDGASCLLARAVYCAQSSGGNGWAAHGYIFENQEQMMGVETIKGFLPKIAEAAGVPADKFTACTASPEAKTAIEKQAAVGTSLQLQGTPTVFANGKRLEGGQIMTVLTEAYRSL